MQSRIFFIITPVFSVAWSFRNHNLFEWMMHLYSAFIVYCHTPKALYNHVGGLSSTTTSVQHPLGWCDGSHRTTAPVHSPHTSYRWRGERVIEPIKLMGIIRRPWLTRSSGGKLARTPGFRAERLIAFAIISRYEKTRFFNRRGCDYTVTWHARVGVKRCVRLEDRSYDIKVRRDKA